MPSQMLPIFGPSTIGSFHQKFPIRRRSSTYNNNIKMFPFFYLVIHVWSWLFFPRPWSLKNYQFFNTTFKETISSHIKPSSICKINVLSKVLQNLLVDAWIFVHATLHVGTWSWHPNGWCSNCIVMQVYIVVVLCSTLLLGQKFPYCLNHAIAQNL